MMDKDKLKERALKKRILADEKDKQSKSFFKKIFIGILVSTFTILIFTNPSKKDHVKVAFPNYERPLFFDIMIKQVSKNTVDFEKLQGMHLEYHNFFIYSYTTLNMNDQKMTYGYLGNVYKY